MSKIAIFTYSIYTTGGEQRVVSLIANELSKKHDVTLFTMDAKHKSHQGIYYLSDKINVRFFNPHRYDLLSFICRGIVHLIPKLAFDVFPKIVDRAYYPDKYAQKMYKCIKSEDDFDTIIVTAWQLSVILGKLVKKYNPKYKTIGWEHSSYEAYFRTKYLYMYRRESIFKEYASLLSEVVVLNEDYAKKYLDNFGISCNIIYNPKSFVSDKRADMANKAFVACGRLSEPKRFDLLIDAYAVFSNEVSDWNLIIIGDGHLRKKLENQATSLGVKDRIHFWGNTNDVITPLLKGSVYLLTSEYEGFPMCLTEAYELGIPAVAFDIPALTPFKGKGEAIAVPTFDVNKYASEMVRLSKNLKLRTEMQKQALLTAAELSIEMIYKEWEKII